jgi:POT family proton-dependent oligopeptide transporter
VSSSLAKNTVANLADEEVENYIQNQRGGAIPGALGLGQQTATNLNNMFLLIQFVTPIPFAILSDAKMGRLKTLFISLG